MSHGYCSQWRLRANVSKIAVMVFSNAYVSGEWATSGID